MSDRLDEIEARCSAATRGPWAQDVMYVTAEVPTGRPGGEVIIQCSETVGRRLPVNHKANAAFIAHARDDVPYLISAVRRLQGSVTELCNLLHGTDD